MAGLDDPEDEEEAEHRPDDRPPDDGLCLVARLPASEPMTSRLGLVCERVEGHHRWIRDEQGARVADEIVVRVRLG